MTDHPDIRCLLTPIPGGNVLLPGSVVAEVVAYSKPEPFREAPEWLLGELQWNGWQIPVINLACLAGTDPNPSVSRRSRILVVKTLTEAASVLHIGVVISGMPHFQTVNAASLSETGVEPETGVFSHVMVDDQPAVIPDLDVLATTIEHAVYRNA